MKNRFLHWLTLFIFLGQALIPVQINAGTKIVMSNTDNETTSANQIQVSDQNAIVIEQENQTAIDNQSAQDLNSGSNQISDQQGETDIQTGAIASETALQTLGSTNQAEVALINNVLQFELENMGNGAASANEIAVKNTSLQEVEQTNRVEVENQVQKDVATGFNQAKDNQGPTTITTGNVSEDTQIKNQTGQNQLITSASTKVEIEIKNNGNGSSSRNIVKVEISAQQKTTQLNQVKIVNQENKNLDTGHNTCQDQLSECRIQTGDIQSQTSLETQVGVNQVTSLHSTPTPTPTQPAQPTVSPPLPTSTPVVTITPSPSPVLGGPIPSVAQPSQPQPVSAVAVMPELEAEPEAEPDLITQLIQQLIPVVQAAAEVPRAAMDEEVEAPNGLPVTGMGGVAPLSWSDIGLGLGFLSLGFYLRRRLNGQVDEQPEKE